MYIVVHVSGRVLRFIDVVPNGEEKAQQAIANTPGARYELAPGPLPRDVEAAAAEFKSAYLSRLADAFLEEHSGEIPDEPTRVTSKSGLHKRLRSVS